VQVDDDWPRFHARATFGEIARQEVRALQREAAGDPQLDVDALDMNTPQPELCRPQTCQVVPTPRGTNDEVPQGQRIRLPGQLEPVILRAILDLDSRDPAR